MVTSYDGKAPNPLEDFFVAPWEDIIAFAVTQEPYCDTDWVYFSRGDSTGFFIYDGTGDNPLAEMPYVFVYDYPDKSRYKPTLIWKDEEGVHILGFLLHDAWKNDEAPTPPLPSYMPVLTGLEELDEVLATLAIDNSDLLQGGSRANCICGMKTDNCRKTSVIIHECNLSYSICDSSPSDLC